MAKATKENIYRAFSSLLNKYDLDKITVTTLVSECNISRQTFYYHFKDIGALVDWSIKQSTAGCLESAKNAKDITDATIIYLNHVKDNRSFLTKCLNSSLSGYTALLIRNSIIEFCTEFNNIRKLGGPNPDDTKFIIDFISNGVTGLIITTFYEKKEIDVEYLAERITTTILKRVI